MSEAWGPGLGSNCAVVLVAGSSRPREEFLARVGDVARRLDSPVQAVRADRVLSHVHVEAAAEHARRSRAAGRARASDAGIEFLSYLAAVPQIGAALDALGVPAVPADAAPGAPVDVLLVALGPRTPDALAATARGSGFEVKAEGPAVVFPAAAMEWWRERLEAPAAPLEELEARVLGRLARLAVKQATAGQN